MTLRLVKKYLNFDDTDWFSLLPACSLFLVLASSASAQCVGDCNGDGRVAVNELVLGSQIALGRAEMSSCPEFDIDENGSIEVDELIDGVASAVRACSGAAHTQTPTPIDTPTPPATLEPSVTPTNLPTSTPTATFTGPTATATSSATSTPTAPSIPTEAVDRDPRGAFRQVQVSTQGATRLTLLTLDWLKLVDQVEELASPDGEPAGPCPEAVSISCQVVGDESVRTIQYSDCWTETPSGHGVRRSGQIVVAVSNEGFCSDGAIAPDDEVMLTLNGYTQREETSEGDLLAGVSANLRITQDGLGAENCAGLDVSERIEGSLHVHCVPDAESLDCPERGADVTLDARGLVRELTSEGQRCKRTSVLDGQWVVSNNLTGERFPQSFEDFRIEEQETPGGSSLAVTLSGNFAANCLGAVAIQPSTLIADVGARCPNSGMVEMLRPSSKPVDRAERAERAASAPSGPTPSPTPDGEGFEQRLFRATNGQVYQVLQFNAGSGENGAEAIRITTVAGSLGGAVSRCDSSAGEGGVPTAVTGAPAGQAFDPESAFKSPVLNGGPLCFNPNAAAGNGAVCAGSDCAADCRCAADANCATFSLGEDGAGRTPIADDGARLVVLGEPFPPCNGFAGREAYAFGTTGLPTTEQELCFPSPEDGLLLRDESILIFAYETKALELFNAAAAGLLVDDSGKSPCNEDQLPAVLSPGQSTIGTAFAPRAEFQGGNLFLHYDDPGDTNEVPDAAIEGCETDVLIECEQFPTPTPSPGAERRCGAIELDSLSATPIEGSMQDRLSDDTGWCGLPTGNRDVVYEFTAAEKGSYIVRLRGATFDPILYARKDECVGGQAIGCVKDPSEGTRDRDLELELNAGERVAIAVDGGRRDGDRFELDLRRRLPDLAIREISAPGAATIGGEISVSVAVENEGMAGAGRFEVRLSVDGDSLTTFACGPIAANATGICGPASAVVGSGDENSQLSIVLDPTGELNEDDRTDNVASRALFVGIIQPIEPGTILRSVHSMTISPDGRHLYAAADDVITVFARDVETGDLGVVEEVPDARITGSMAFGPDGTILYGCSSGSLLMFLRNDETGDLTLDDDSGRCSSVVFSPTGQPIFLSGLIAAAAAAGYHLYGGELAYEVSISSLDSLGSTTGSRPLVPGLIGLVGGEARVLGPDANQLYAARSYQPNIGGCRDVDVSARHDLAVFNRNPSTGDLSIIELQTPEPFGPVCDMAYTGDGRIFFAAGCQREIYAFRRFPTGPLALGQVRTDGGRLLAVSPEGTHLYAASEVEIRTFRIIR